VGRLAQVLVAVVLFVAAIVLGLWGLLLVLYHGEGHSSDTYVLLAGQKVAAQVVGAVALAVAVAALGVLAVVLSRRGV
jgi:hypothetical protein